MNIFSKKKKKEKFCNNMISYIIIFIFMCFFIMN